MFSMLFNYFFKKFTNFPSFKLDKVISFLVMSLSIDKHKQLHVASGKNVGIVDLTIGEMGTRGTIETRAKEADFSAKLLDKLSGRKARTS
jgi:hypothetical protein